MLIVEYNGYELEYKRFGTGKKIMFAFHGFNRSADDFRILVPSLGSAFTILSFNLLYYGNSCIKKEGDPPLHVSDLRGLIEKTLEKEGFTRFSVMGYSLGGRIAMICTELFPDKVDLAILIAPDGLKLSYWYRIAVHSAIGRNIYHSMIESPALFYKLADFLLKKGIISENLYNFASWHMSSKSQREMVYKVWMAFRKIIPNPSHIRKLSRKYNFKIHLLMGRFDSVIPVKSAKALSEPKEKNIVLHVLNSGHRLINQGLNQHLEKILENEV